MNEYISFGIAMPLDNITYKTERPYHDAEPTPDSDEVLSQIVALSERMTVLEELVNRLYELTVYPPGHD